MINNRGNNRTVTGKSAQRQHPAGRWQAGMMVLGTVLALMLLSGCASTGARGGTAEGSLEYNPETGYPLIGGPRWFF
jgi:hypothetical protein